MVCSAGSGEPFFGVAQHVTWGQVIGEVVASESDAVVKFHDLESQGRAAALFGPDGRERMYYGIRGGRDREMQHWWDQVRASQREPAKGLAHIPKLYHNADDADAEPPPLSCLVVGAGNRGWNYSEHPRLRPVAVADPSEGNRLAFASRHVIPPERQFARWEDAMAARSAGSFEAEVCMITTPDRLHVGPAVEATKIFRGLILEKPMAVTDEDCTRIVDACRANQTLCAVCHVLRYTYANLKVRDLIRAGEIGEVLSINHVEPVGYYHFAHSFVRGNWRREDESTFSLLAKCCHDVDLIAFWMEHDAPVRVSSFGSLQHFRPDKKPAAAQGCSRCVDCPLQETCPYSAPRMYIKGESVEPLWSAPLVDGLPDIENVREALRTGPYGRCVYDCDNDVCDHQVVNVEFESGAVATLTMVACTERLCQRETKVYGSLGELVTTDPKTVQQVDFRSGRKILHSMGDAKHDEVLTAHGGADQLLVDSFVRAVHANDPSLVLTGPDESLKTHRLAFQAEQSRKSKQVLGIRAPCGCDM